MVQFFSTENFHTRGGYRKIEHDSTNRFLADPVACGMNQLLYEDFLKTEELKSCLN